MPDPVLRRPGKGVAWQGVPDHPRMFSTRPRPEHGMIFKALFGGGERMETAYGTSRPPTG